MLSIFKILNSMRVYLSSLSSSFFSRYGITLQLSFFLRGSGYDLRIVLPLKQARRIPCTHIFLNCSTTLAMINLHQFIVRTTFCCFSPSLLTVYRKFTINKDAVPTRTRIHGRKIAEIIFMLRKEKKEREKWRQGNESEWERDFNEICIVIIIFHARDQGKAYRWRHTEFMMKWFIIFKDAWRREKMKKVDKRKSHLFAEIDESLWRNFSIFQRGEIKKMFGKMK